MNDAAGWAGKLTLDYRRSADRTVLHDRHHGPLRVLRSLYPEGAGVCHTVLVHPPGGLAGGDSLHIDATLAPETHAVLTTPGATRFYRSLGAHASQTLRLAAAAGSRLEWLPLETLVHPGALAQNHLRFDLASGAEMIGWDVLALGLPASGQPFDRGRITQHIELPGVWLERGLIDGSDTRLLDGPFGWAGHRVLATLWFATGSPMLPGRRDALLSAARQACTGHTLERTAGVTSTDSRLVVLRALAPRVEPAMQLLIAAWAAWRRTAWAMPACAPRVWST